MSDIECVMSRRGVWKGGGGFEPVVARRELAARSLRGARSHRNGCNGKCKGVAADNILKRARVCCGQSSRRCGSRTMLKRARRRERKTEGGRGLRGRERVVRKGRACPLLSGLFPG